MAKKKGDSVNASIFFELKLNEVTNRIMKEYFHMEGVPAFFLSNPGIGKTTTVYAYAALKGYEVELLRGNASAKDEICGYDCAPSEIKEGMTKAAVKLRPTWFDDILKNKEEGKKTLLFLDELTTASPEVQSALLNVIFERRVGNEYLPDDTMVVAAGNYASNLSNLMELMAPTMNRFSLFNLSVDYTDLETFSMFTGAIANDGEIPDFKEELLKTLKDLDNQETTFDKKLWCKASEFFERAINNALRMLETGSEKKVDFKVSDLNNMYTDSSLDKVLGFPTMRTKLYMTLMCSACWFSFGKAGIYSKNFERVIEGLVGMGVTRDKKTGDVKYNNITVDIHNAIKSACTEVEKLNSTALPKYEKFFVDITKDDKKGRTFTIPELQAIFNKLTEMKNDRDIASIDRPVDVAVITKMCSIFKSNGDLIINTKIAPGKKVEDELTPEKLTGIVTSWNSLADVINEVKKLTDNTEKNYSSDIKTTVNETVTYVSDAGFKLKSLKKILLLKNEALGNLITEVKELKK